MKIPGFFHRLNPGILYPGIFQESKSQDFLVPGFFDPGISRDIPGPGYPVDIPTVCATLLGPERKSSNNLGLVSHATNVINKMRKMVHTGRFDVKFQIHFEI